MQGFTLCADIVLFGSIHFVKVILSNHDLVMSVVVAVVVSVGIVYVPLSGFTTIFTQRISLFCLNIL